MAATLRAVELVLEGRTTATAQDEAAATHQPLCRDEHAGIDWRRPTAELHNLVRGCDPSPGAHSLVGGEPIRLYGSRRHADRRVAEPGTVVGIGDGGIEVATADGSLRLAKIAIGGKKSTAAEAAAAAGIETGAKLGPQA